MIILFAVLLLLFLALKIYVAMEERKRAEMPGNADKYNADQLEKHSGSPLEGKTIIFLGSSVTYGAAAEGQSFVELFEAVDGVNAIKEAVSGTTLVDRDPVLTTAASAAMQAAPAAAHAAPAASGDGDSYIKRLKQLDRSAKVDCVVVQLSTNDATLKLPLGEISESTDPGSFDTQTITGAMEWIIRYSRDTWNCPVVFYTGSRYDSPEYAAMVGRLMELKEKWDLGVIDLYTDDEFNAIDKEAYDFYMRDPIHPTKAGYVEWWFPKMEKDLIGLLSGSSEGRQ